MTEIPLAGEFSFSEGEKKFDPAIAEQLIGCTLLLGLTTRAPDDSVIKREQIFGTVETCDLKNGMVIRLPDGQRFTTAPMTWTVRVAESGTYRLKATEEIVEDPDFVAAFSCYQATN